MEIGRQGEAVVVAHAAWFALAREPRVLRVHVTAPTEVRLRRLWVPNKMVSEQEYCYESGERLTSPPPCGYYAP
jgi:hypothetical protein